MTSTVGHADDESGDDGNATTVRRGEDGDDDDNGNGEDNAPYETMRLPRKLNASSWTANNNAAAAISANIATNRWKLEDRDRDDDIPIKGCRFGLF